MIIRNNPLVLQLRYQTPDTNSRSRGRAARLSSAKAPTAVRIRSRPPSSAEVPITIETKADILDPEQILFRIFYLWKAEPRLRETLRRAKSAKAPIAARIRSRPQQ